MAFPKIVDRNQWTVVSMTIQNPHPDVVQFLDTYTELVRRGAWMPNLVDEDLPALVWIDFVALWDAANREGLHLPPPPTLIRRLKGSRQGAPAYPRATRGPRTEVASKAREYHVTFHDPFDESGAYPPSQAFVARARHAKREALRQDLLRREAECPGTIGDIEAVLDDMARHETKFY